MTWDEIHWREENEIRNQSKFANYIKNEMTANVHVHSAMIYF